MNINKDLFVNPVPNHLFRQTNAAWNDYRLNAPWSVGYVSTLIESTSFSNKEEWENYYYQSGENRTKILQNLSPVEQALLEDDLLIKNNPAFIRNKIPKKLKIINTQYGRTAVQLKRKGTILYEKVKSFIKDISPKDCVESVRFRVICETWNGIIIREHNAILFLQKQFPALFFKKTIGDFDHRFAVDYEVFNQQNCLLGGLQIKPVSYLKSNTYILKAKAANKKKNDLYFSQYGANVIDVIAHQNGKIENWQEVIVFLKSEST